MRPVDPFVGSNPPRYPPIDSREWEDGWRGLHLFQICALVNHFFTPPGAAFEVSSFTKAIETLRVNKCYMTQPVMAWKDIIYKGTRAGPITWDLRDMTPFDDSPLKKEKGMRPRDSPIPCSTPG